MVEEFGQFAAETGRSLKLEIEPGTFLLANSGVLVATAQDVVSTGDHGRLFVKLDAGMTEVLRPSMYGAQHPITLHQTPPRDDKTMVRVTVVGHCCESGDIMTPVPGDSDLVDHRMLPSPAIGDIIVVGGAGAYCSSMSTKGYNSFPEAPEVLLDTSGQLHLIRARQNAADLWAYEIPLP